MAAAKIARGNRTSRPRYPHDVRDEKDYFDNMSTEKVNERHMYQLRLRMTATELESYRLSVQ